MTPELTFSARCHLANTPAKSHIATPETAGGIEALTSPHARRYERP